METETLAVIMPVYNEEGAIGPVISKWTTKLSELNINFKIHAYNDGSKDKTLSILSTLSENNKNLIVHDKANSGHGPTILLGYRENIDSTWIFQIDSDDDMSPESFSKLWENRAKYDFLIGERVRFNQPIVRKFISSISRITVWLLYGWRVYDVNSPYRLMRSKIFNNIFNTLSLEIFAPNVIIAGFASLNKLNIYKINVEQTPRETGVVSIKKFKLLKAAIKSFMQTIIWRFKIS